MHCNVHYNADEYQRKVSILREKYERICIIYCCESIYKRNIIRRLLFHIVVKLRVDFRESNIFVFHHEPRISISGATLLVD